jgi:hypothetical protein
MTGFEHDRLASLARSSLHRAEGWLKGFDSGRTELRDLGLAWCAAATAAGPAPEVAAHLLEELQGSRPGSAEPVAAVTDDPVTLGLVSAAAWRELGRGRKGAEWAQVLPVSVTVAGRAGDLELMLALTRALLRAVGAERGATPLAATAAVRRLLVHQHVEGWFPATVPPAALPPGGGPPGAATPEAGSRDPRGPHTGQDRLRTTVSGVWLLAGVLRPELLAPEVPVPPAPAAPAAPARTAADG